MNKQTEQPAQEPVGYASKASVKTAQAGGNAIFGGKKDIRDIALFTHPAPQPEQKPVALSKLLHQVIHGDFNGDNADDLRLALEARNELLKLTHPSEFKTLTEDEIKILADKKEFWWGLDSDRFEWGDFARAIEQALKEKNHG
jgi:hypothetical protein